MKTKGLQIATRENQKEKGRCLHGPRCEKKKTRWILRHMNFSVIQEDVTPTTFCAFLFGHYNGKANLTKQQKNADDVRHTRIDHHLVLPSLRQESQTSCFRKACNILLH
ncbi:hypothetical protein PoB_003548200 [Plakobranchus ocellatus]|uniref:Uncharacterized protein n=1 Tax=Plakobranchus ocellatus TaxID=259542 RepID=A0AAV4ANX4_9GAST|nr:hypothetical protein PoB_003548200 [Plakobranchus ocellatus]